MIETGEIIKMDAYIDFVETDARCSMCHRPLSSGKAVVFNKKNFGNTCARKQGIDVSNIPDLTKGSIAETANTEIVSSGIGKKGVDLKYRDSVKQKCLSYLILRCDKLKDIKKIQYSGLNGIYSKYTNHSINQDDIRHISNIINLAERKFKEFSIENLYFCYAVKCQLENLKKRYHYEIFDSFLIYLHEHATLTIKQFNVLMKYSPVKIKYYDYQSDE